MSKSVSILLLAFTGTLGTACAQVASAILLGEIRDESFAVVPDVTVNARNSATGFTRTTVTNAQGVYRVDELLPGAYTGTAAKEGFRPVSVESFVLEVNHNARLDLVLKIGVERNSLIVQGAVSPVRSDDASAGFRLDSREINALPLGQRNTAELIRLGPGAIPRQLGGFTHDVVNNIQENRGANALTPPSTARALT